MFKSIFIIIIFAIIVLLHMSQFQCACLHFFCYTGSETHTQNRAENIQAFFDWLNTHGVDTTNVSICEFKGYGYGLKAEKDFKVGVYKQEEKDLWLI